ncbi:uncharacterized protein [Centruroides vittatus]|uniref:uncharacterized protein isoform X1 n=1 Tax=Centruroides vittatus TaxID=120091 RepID=UPI0035107C99
MELIITAVFLVNLLNINAIYIEKNNKNTTLVMKERNEQLSDIASKHIVNVTEMKLKSHLAAKPKCLRTCWWLQGGCYNMTTNTCYCPNDTVMIGTQCFGKSYLGEFCFYDKQCQAPNSGCFISSFARTCQCKSNYVRIYYSCYETVSLGGFCLTSEQCKTQNSRCVNFCMCKYGYTRHGDKCLPGSINYDSKTFRQLDDGIIALLAIFVVIVFVIIIISIISCLRRQSRFQTNEANTIQPPPTIFSVQLPPEYSSNINERTLQSQASESNLQNTDKPPSYEEAVRSYE